MIEVQTGWVYLQSAVRTSAICSFLQFLHAFAMMFVSLARLCEDLLPVFVVVFPLLLPDEFRVVLAVLIVVFFVVRLFPFFLLLFCFHCEGKGAPPEGENEN